jgi:hypothetical protein
MENDTAEKVEEYICEECGTTTPVKNDSCPSCGGKLMPFDAEPEEVESDDDLFSGVEESTDGGSESLESLAEDELNEDQRSYNEDSYGDE